MGREDRARREWRKGVLSKTKNVNGGRKVAEVPECLPDHPSLWNEGDYLWAWGD